MATMAMLRIPARLLDTTDRAISTTASSSVWAHGLTGAIAMAGVAIASEALVEGDLGEILGQDIAAGPAALVLEAVLAAVIPEAAQAVVIPATEGLAAIPHLGPAAAAGPREAMAAIKAAVTATKASKAGGE
jgi:hypothetical protein